MIDNDIVRDARGRRVRSVTCSRCDKEFFIPLSRESWRTICYDCEPRWKRFLEGVGGVIGGLVVIVVAAVVLLAWGWVYMKLGIDFNDDCAGATPGC